MPILSQIQRRSPRGRLLLAGIYLVLAVGAVAMVYPFFLMLSGSTKSELDMHQLDVVPRVLHDDRALFQRYEEQRYVRLDTFNVAALPTDRRGARVYAFDQLQKPGPGPDAVLQAWEDFLLTQRNAPEHEFALGHFAADRSVAELQLRFQNELVRQFPGLPRADLTGLAPVEEWGLRSYHPMEGPFGKVYADLRRQLPSRYFYPLSVRGLFVVYALPLSYPPNAEGLANLNRAWETHYETFAQVELPRAAPPAGPARTAWWDFVRGLLSGRFVRFADSLAEPYRQFLAGRYGTLPEYNRTHAVPAAAWNEIALPRAGAPAVEVSDAEDFLKILPGPDGVSLASTDFKWADYLQDRFPGGVDQLNIAWSSHYGSFEAVPMPILLHDYATLQSHRGEILREFLTRNYRVVWNQIVLGGKGLKNTVIFCLLNVLAALIVNPLAAYALSRFQPRWGQSALFVVMATMAFPAEVTQIPSFLLLRDFGMLNTFAALVIPAAANGYLIFLLKGFFDSLPNDLYEAASLDGCGELRAFFQITVPLSTPILAVVALSAFTAAYGAFMFSLLVCQKESMWTLMVYIYQLQQSYAPPILFAALVIAAVPTLVIFILCQNIILRGIVVPIEK